jgi:hypothetical protein
MVVVALTGALFAHERPVRMCLVVTSNTLAAEVKGLAGFPVYHHDAVGMIGAALYALAHISLLLILPRSSPRGLAFQ